jgi:arylsulfatase
MPFESQMYLRWYADNMWLFIPVGRKVKEFLVTIPQYPFAEGAGMQPSNINYMTLKAAEALKRLTAIEQEPPNPNN